MKEKAFVAVIPSFLFLLSFPVSPPQTFSSIRVLSSRASFILFPHSLSPLVGVTASFVTLLFVLLRYSRNREADSFVPSSTMAAIATEAAPPGGGGGGGKRSNRRSSVAVMGDPVRKKNKKKLIRYKYFFSLLVGRHCKRKRRDSVRRRGLDRSEGRHWRHHVGSPDHPCGRHRSSNLPLLACRGHEAGAGEEKSSLTALKNILSVAKTAPAAAAAIILETTAAIAAVDFKKSVSFRSSKKNARKSKPRSSAIRHHKIFPPSHCRSTSAPSFSASGAPASAARSDPASSSSSPAWTPSRWWTCARSRSTCRRRRSCPGTRSPSGWTRSSTTGSWQGQLFFLVNFILSRIIQVGYLSALHQTNCFPPRKKLL